MAHSSQLKIDALLNSDFSSSAQRSVKKEPIPAERKPKSKPTSSRMSTDIASRMAIRSLLNDDRPSAYSSSMASTSKQPECDICGKKFTQRADVRKHKKTVHEKARDYHCPECPLSFGEKGNLNKHIKSIHRKERNFVCEQCGSSFPFRNGLTEHIRMKHTDERPFTCPICNSSFKKKSHLHRHVSVVHNKM